MHYALSEKAIQATDELKLDELRRGNCANAASVMRSLPDTRMVIVLNIKASVQPQGLEDVKADQSMKRALIPHVMTVVQRTKESYHHQE